MNETEREREKFEEKRTNTRYQKRRLYRRKKKDFSQPWRAIFVAHNRRECSISDLPIYTSLSVIIFSLIFFSFRFIYAESYLYMNYLLVIR